MKKFRCPDLLYIAQQLSLFEDVVDRVTSNLSTLLDDDNEDKVNYSSLVEVILSQIFDRTLDLKTEIKSLREEFPDMPLSEWNKFNERYDKFINSADGLKLNKD